jgi:prepilin-type N-terminal cleavage/methylation domain-containing protein
MFRKARAFTLVELMVVIVIIGFLAAMALPRLLSMTTKARLAEFKPQLKTIYTLQETYLAERGSYAATSDFTEDNASIGFKQPVTGNFSYSVLTPDVSVSLSHAEVAVTQLRVGKSIKLSNNTVLTSTDGLIACIDADGVQYATSAQVVSDGNLSSAVDLCN